MSQDSYDYATRQGLHPIGWNDFHGICKGLALAVAPYQPEAILPVGRGGYYPGTLLAHMLQVEVYPVRLSRRVNDVVRYEEPQWIAPPPAAIAGQRVLVVDEICDSGETLRMVGAKARALGAAEVRSAVLFAHTWSAEIPDYIGVITDELLLNPWDREVLREGVFQFHPEYAEALKLQGVDDPDGLRIPAGLMRPAKSG